MEARERPSAESKARVREKIMVFIEQRLRPGEGDEEIQCCKERGSGGCCQDHVQCQDIGREDREGGS